jgi:hypothetical protein
MTYPIRMVHPAHGATNVYNTGERAAFEAKGWKLQTQEEFLAILAAKAGVPKITEADAAELPPPKPRLRRVKP